MFFRVEFTLAMEADLKIGAVFSLAPGNISPPTPDDTPDASEDPTGAADDSGAADDTQRSTGDNLDADNSTDNASSSISDTHSTDNEVVASADDAPFLTAEGADGQDYTEMTADDCDVSVNIGNEADDVITGTDPEMNSSSEVNNFEIVFETGVVNTESAFSPDISTDNPPELPMEGHVGTLSSVFPEGMEEALPPPILSPVISETVKVKQEPIDYDG